MARSYRKPVATEGYGGSARRTMKRVANHKVRSYGDKIADGGAYRKIFYSWLICDFKFDCRFYPSWNEWAEKEKRK